MSARDAILGKVRASLGVSGKEKDRAEKAAVRISTRPSGIIPERAKLPAKQQVKLFKDKIEEAFGTVAKVKARGDVPKEVARYLRQKNLPAEIRMGEDTRFQRMGWKAQKALTVKTGASDGDDLAGLSYAVGGVAETGTLVLGSGPDNPVTINFLPDFHIVVVDSKDVAGDMETVWKAVRKKYGNGSLPRTVNLVTGPSRSGDIEQKLILGAHGPRALHVIVVE